MRIFLAINLQPELRRAVAESTTPLREIDGVSWVSEDRLHLTLKFLGEQPDSEPERLRPFISRVAASNLPFSATLRGVGAFPNFRRPRVVWLGIEPEARLERLQQKLEHSCELLGHPAEARSYQPHLTLGRVRQRLSPEPARSLTDAADRIRFNDTLPITSVDLMQSLPGPKPEYVTLFRAPLAGA